MLLFLLAGVAAPALAAGDPGDRHGDRGDRADRSEKAEKAEARQQARSERSNDGGERPQFNVQHNGGNVHQQVVVQDGGQNGGPPAEVRHQRSGGFHQVQPDTQGSSNNVRTWRRDGHQWNAQPTGEAQVVTQDDGVRRFRQHDRAVPNVMRSRTPVISQIPRQGTQPPLRVENHRRDRVQWSSNWRNNHKYDWREHRRHHRSFFHLGFYYDPFGWGYQPYSIGWRLWPNYFSSRYWISDPWQYRLPYAPPGTRWIRYWNDAILVDTYTGEVVDVIRDFFW